LFAGHQVLLGGDLAGLLGLDELGNAARGERRVGASLIFGTVWWADAGAGAEFGRDVDALAGGVQPRGRVAQCIWVRASAYTGTAPLTG
jgi:hypothetical protein